MRAVQEVHENDVVFLLVPKMGRGKEHGRRYILNLKR